MFMPGDDVIDGNASALSTTASRVGAPDAVEEWRPYRAPRDACLYDSADRDGVDRMPLHSVVGYPAGHAAAVADPLPHPTPSQENGADEQVVQAIGSTSPWRAN